MELVLVLVSCGMLIGSIYFFVKNEEREAVKSSAVNRAALEASEAAEIKFDKGMRDIEKLTERVTALETKPAAGVQSLIPNRITVEVIERSRSASVPVVDNSAAKASLDLLRESSKAAQAIKGLKKVRSQGSRATQ